MSVDEASSSSDGGGWVHITLKSGAKVSARVTEFVKRKNGLGDFSGFSWTNFGHGEMSLFHLDPNEVAAVVWESR